MVWPHIPRGTVGHRMDLDCSLKEFSLEVDASLGGLLVDLALSGIQNSTDWDIPVLAPPTNKSPVSFEWMSRLQKAKVTLRSIVWIQSKSIS